MWIFQRSMSRRRYNIIAVCRLLSVSPQELEAGNDQTFNPGILLWGVLWVINSRNLL